jgi:L-asparagine transporter-like permease
MNYKTVSILIFVALMFLLVFMGYNPSPATVIWGGIAFLVLLVFQVYFILKSNDESGKKFEDDDWYEHP